MRRPSRARCAEPGADTRPAKVATMTRTSSPSRRVAGECGLTRAGPGGRQWPGRRDPGRAAPAIRVTGIVSATRLVHTAVTVTRSDQRRAPGPA